MANQGVQSLIAKQQAVLGTLTLRQGNHEEKFLQPQTNYALNFIDSPPSASREDGTPSVIPGSVRYFGSLGQKLVLARFGGGE